MTDKTEAWRAAFDERHQFDVYPDHFMTGMRNEFCAGWHAALKSQSASQPKPAISPTDGAVAYRDFGRLAQYFDDIGDPHGANVIRTYRDNLYAPSPKLALDALVKGETREQMRERLSRKVLEMPDNPNELIGLWHEHHFVTQPSSGISICATCGVSEVAARRAAHHASQPKSLTDWRDVCAALIDIYDDAMNNAPEHRCYVESAWEETLDEARALLESSK